MRSLLSRSAGAERDGTRQRLPTLAYTIAVGVQECVDAIAVPGAAPFRLPGTWLASGRDSADKPK